ncbi:RNA-dependent RNA polymerase [Picobirnavirus dog/KNA/2015]|uniref:RNA-dependent RNA polymerase n=1 Tax=Picobirnavirus dog/KNA/2015 TaxID=1961162 RepID=UPI000B5B82AF|nr:RNA-dependent RNA polymerase [Picobirnavirus dog/KNA/2015]AQS79277.1 RNA-dependent RNA polymerase [Picobirnavirus dog/KNA/2015]
MPKNNVISFENCFQLPNQGLRTYFGNVVKGQNRIYDTPFARGESTSDLLKKWDETLVSISDKWPTLYEFEVDLAKKVGPMSVMKPLKDRMADIDAYYDGISLPSDPIMERALAATLHEWSSARGLQVRNVDRTVRLMKKSTNSGSPYFRKRRLVTDDTIPCRIQLADEVVNQFLPGGNFEACAILGWRGQEGGPKPSDTKQRVVWMFPYAVNVEELRVYQPLIEAAQRFNLVPAWVSMDAVDRGVTKLFDTKSKSDLIVCTDFTKFDQHFNHSLQTAAQTLLAGIFTSTKPFQDWSTSIFPIKYVIPLAYDYGKVRSGRHGMGSGSGGTNADETLAHRALQYEAAIRSNQRLNPNSQCLGDDGILSYPNITVEDVVRAYTSHGLEMNDSKQYASTHDCTYLRRWHHYDYRENGICVGVYSTNRALGRLRYLERYYDPEMWGPKMVALRQLSIIENVKYHPLRDQFAEFCMKRDKYRLGIDIPGFLDNIEVEAKKAIEYMPDFMGYTKTLQQGSTEDVGISSWWIVNYLKSR